MVWAHIFSETETLHKFQLAVVVQIHAVIQSLETLAGGQTSHMFDSSMGDCLGVRKFLTSILKLRMVKEFSTMFFQWYHIDQRPVTSEARLSKGYQSLLQGLTRLTISSFATERGKTHIICF